MLERASKLLIGKDINRDVAVVAGALITTVVLDGNLADGEVVVLDKNFKVLAAGATIADTDIIYICQGTGTQYSYINEAGTAVTDSRKILLSDPIYGRFIRKFEGRSYKAKSEQVTALTFTSLTPVVGTEYFIRIIYKDLNEHPGQFTHTYRFVATSTDSDDVATGLKAKIDAHKGARITAAAAASVLTLTGKAQPENTTSLSDIDKFSMVEFDVVMNYVSVADATKGQWITVGATTATTEAEYGSGTWTEVRDLEKRNLPYTGPTNNTLFPVVKPDFVTVKDSTYHLIIIEHDRPYRSPDNQYEKFAPLTTIIAMVVPSSGAQLTNVLGQLNPWIESTPSSLIGISF